MIKQFGDYDKTQAYGNRPTLPKGGYILKIENVEACTNSMGDYLKIAVDIEGGDYHHFFLNDWKAQRSEDKKWHCNYLLNIPKDDGTERDGWTKRKFKTFTEALEDSNPGYHFDWDEEKFKGKLIGGLFNEREYEANDGQIRRAINLAQVCAVERIKNNDYTLPEDKVIERYTREDIGTQGFVDIPEGIDADLPFK